MNKLTEVVSDEPDLVFVSDRHASIYASIRKVHYFVNLIVSTITAYGGNYILVVML